QLVFHNVQFQTVQRDGLLWLSAPQIASALQYADQSSVTRIYARHADEFTNGMTASVKLTDPKGDKQETRIFSLRGAHLIAMFARTPIAKEFRRWVLDILDREAEKSAIPPQPHIQPQFT
ncbi:BRO-N domain-containing protein, partial [Escherichia coli]